ncbi:MAG TPA: hypothetical protein VLE93_02550 [Candidatus Saccharimonadales bacterium]|nr:hypothetical protein [Candidatus Saccharimonadales bacterium]
MSSTDWINTLTILVLIVFLVAGVLLVIVLYRANRWLYKLDHLNETARQFVKEIVPAIVNMGTISVAVQSILRTVSEHLHELRKNQKGK